MEEVPDKVKAMAKPGTPLQDWSSRGLAQSLDMEEVVLSVVSSCLAVPIEVVQRQNFSSLPSHPLKIRNELNDWPAMQSWTLEKLLQKCGESSFRMDDLHPGRMRLCQFYKYMRHNSDDSPLYIFDSQFARGKNAKRKSLVHDYSPIFSGIENDLFSIVPDRGRPPWRWFLLGGQRSGTDIHTDPLGTSAWNAVVQGTKLWLFFPPDSDPNTVSPEHRRGKRSAIEWFLDVWPSIDQQKFYDPGVCTPTYTIQERGEVVFVPRGWWHVVINLTTTVAVTHNFAMIRDIEYIVPDVLANSPETFARRWILECVTQEHLPSLSEAILSMAVDGDSSIQRFLQDTLKGDFEKDDVWSTDDDSGCDSDHDEMPASLETRRANSTTKVADVAIKILDPATVIPKLKKRGICSLCNRPSTVCVCSVLPKKRIHLKKCRAIVLSHPHERKRKNSSVPIISLCLDAQSMIIHHGRHFTRGSHGDTVLNSMASRVLLVFPAPEAISLDSALQQPTAPSIPLSTSPVGSYSDANDRRVVNVVFIDGTWQHAKEMVASNIQAGRFPKETKMVKISINDMRSWPPEKSGICSYKPRRFDIRTPPSPEHFSTGETMAWVLSKIENDPSLYECLLRPLDLMVEKWNFCKKVRQKTGDRSSRYDDGRKYGPGEQRPFAAL
jgi:histone arginine demethylase JMJD6